MTLFTYTQPSAIQSDEIIDILNEQGETVLRYQREYSNRFKKIIDIYMDYRYFVHYKVYDLNEHCLFSVKKMSRKNRIHFRAKDFALNKDYMIAYDGWKLMIPDLIITDGKFKMMLNKEMEEWSNFCIDERVVARWKAEYDQTADCFIMSVEIIEERPEQPLAFYIGIAQATLFIGA